MLEIKDLEVEVAGKKILKNVNLVINKGEVHALFGPNGIGKTSLLNVIMGLSGYKITRGEIIFKGVKINDLPVNERAKLGIGILFQRPPVVRGVKLKQIALISSKNTLEEEYLHKLAREVQMEEFLSRDVNFGFSGGEIKRAEILQLLAQSPDLALLDEPESGVDLENISILGYALNKLLQKDLPIRERKRSALIITHTGHILKYVLADVGHIMLDGRIMCTGNPEEILRDIKKFGYKECILCHN